MPCHGHLASDMHCFGCCPFSPYDVSNNAHEETPIVSSYILGDFDSSYPLHDPTTCVHHMLPMNKHAIDVPYTCMLNLHPHRVIHNNYSFMMDDMFLYHASNFFERCLSCTNSHVHIHIMMDDVYIYHAHNFFGLCLLCRYPWILVNLAIPWVDKTSSREQWWLGIPWIIFPTALFAQRLRAFLLHGPHLAMGSFPLHILCPSCHVHFAWYAYSYAFVMHLWPMLCITYVSWFSYLYVYLQAWWRYCLLLSCLLCAPFLWWYYDLSLCSCLRYVMCIAYAYYLLSWHDCHDLF